MHHSEGERVLAGIGVSCSRRNAHRYGKGDSEQYTCGSILVDILLLKRIPQVFHAEKNKLK